MTIPEVEFQPAGTKCVDELTIQFDIKVQHYQHYRGISRRLSGNCSCLHRISQE